MVHEFQFGIGGPDKMEDEEKTDAILAECHLSKTAKCIFFFRIEIGRTKGSPEVEWRWRADC